MALLRRISLCAFCACILCVSAFALDDTPPTNVPFYGSAFVSGDSVQLGNITLYFPISYREGYLGTDSNGYLYNVSNTSITCYLEGHERCNIPAWSYPRYRDFNSDYVDLHILPTSSNAVIADDVPPLYNMNQLLPYCTILFLGVLVLCFMKRW